MDAELIFSQLANFGFPTESISALTANIAQSVN